MVTMLARLLKVLNSEAEPGQISLALCCSLIIGLTPLMSLHNLVIVFLVFFLRVNLTAFLLGWLLFSGMAYLLDPLFHVIGYQILTAGVMVPLWTALYNMTLFRIENFNNSIVMGSLLFTLVTVVPFYFLSNMLIVRYRDHILSWVEKTRLVQALKASRLHTVYQTISGVGGI